ncbi:Uncharacterised protein [Collinsella aerofaciens]|uniref:Uncharacterized protein n=1 Tax=Collinsella aerofaciens TaxID=74426 RepID=A0A5K1J2H2_9ACTN|nr:Uncharacterised protein [Collinsella aerofaciens]VWL98999.1 Uncharacterised protein [Collinsella aerofaciens]
MPLSRLSLLRYAWTINGSQNNQTHLNVRGMRRHCKELVSQKATKAIANDMGVRRA